MASQQFWDSLASRFQALNEELVQGSLDQAKRQGVQKELAHIKALLEKKAVLDALQKQIDEAQEQSKQASDPEFAQLYQEELIQLRADYQETVQALEALLYPPDPHDDRHVYLEIRAGAGGQEAALFVTDLLKMYTNYALLKGWKTSIESSSDTDLGGLREVVIYIKGKHVFGHLKHESGVHRVQRVPKTETQGRVHTSTATVAVLPEADEVEVVINPADLRIDVYRSSGAGGQHVNTTDSAVRITHIPTGVVVACQDERSQHKNKEKALKILKSRILAAQMEQKEAEMRKQRKEQVGTGMRAEKVRTYNFPQNRVTDHQVEITLQKLDRVIEGDLDEIIQALMRKASDERRKQQTAQG